MKNKQRVPAPRGRQSDDLAAYEVGSGRISLRCASMTRKLVPNIPGIRGISGKVRHRSRKLPQRVLRELVIAGAFLHPGAGGHIVSIHQRAAQLVKPR